MLTRIMTAGLLAGVIAGLFVSALQHVTTVPLILQAETYENGAPAPAAPKADHHSSWQFEGDAQVILAHAPAPGEETAASPSVWAPADGLERTAFTTLATIGTAVGFALMLLAAMLASGTPVTAQSGTAWGMAAFLATGLAPGMGLPPELPGAAAADLVARQTWWLGTAMATAGGIYFMTRSAMGAAAMAVGAALIALPHVIGAPHPGMFASPVPAELAAHFVSQSLAVHAVMWVLVGATAGWVWQRLSAESAPSDAVAGAS
ncbi:MAG: CbtA family protein [Hyphomicrobium sp.]